MLFFFSSVDIQDSLKKLDWSKQSISFDKMDITKTRPGFGIVAFLDENQITHQITDALNHNLLMKTRKEFEHVTVFQVFLSFENDYDPKSLPVNLLSTLKEYLDKSLFDEFIKKLNKEILENDLSVELTDEFLILGAFYPSHLTVKVNCKRLEDTLQEFKQVANKEGEEWIFKLSEELKRKGFNGKKGKTGVGSFVEGKGWKLQVGYTNNSDYQTHVTLGLLRASKEINKLILSLFADFKRDLDSNFSHESYQSKFDSQATEYALKLKEYKQKLTAQLNTKSTNPSINETDINQKSKLTIKVFGSNFSELANYYKEVLGLGENLKSINWDNKMLKVKRIGSNVINMDRIQNFEP